MKLLTYKIAPALLLLTCLGCEPKLAPPPPPVERDLSAVKPVEPAKPAEPAAPVDAAKPAEPAHDHAAPHGGALADTKTGHVELKAAADGQLMVWLYDDKLAPAPIEGAEVSVKVALPGYADVKLTGHNDHLMGKGAPITGDHMAAIVTIKRGDQTETAKVELHLAPHDAPAAPAKDDAHGHDHAHGEGDHKH
jgi:hypothetical protein